MAVYYAILGEDMEKEMLEYKPKTTLPPMDYQWYYENVGSEVPTWSGGATEYVLTKGESRLYFKTVKQTNMSELVMFSYNESMRYRTLPKETGRKLYADAIPHDYILTATNDYQH